MSIKQYRVPSVNNSPMILNGVVQTDLLDFKLSGNVIDPSTSYIALEMTLTQPVGQPVDNLFLSFQGKTGLFTYTQSHALIKDAYIVFASKGKVEERLDINSLNHTLQRHLNGIQSERFARDGNCFSKVNSRTGFVSDNAFRILDKEQGAQQVPVECKIMLKDILETCKLTEIDLNRWGECHLYLKLNLDALIVAQNLGDDPALPSCGGLTGANPFWATGTPTNLTGQCNDIASTALAVNTVILSDVRLVDTQRAPFWVGQKLNCKLTIEGSAEATIPLIVLSVDVVKTTGASTSDVHLTFTTNLMNAGAARTITLIQLYGFDNPGTLQDYLSIPKVELVMTAVKAPTKALTGASIMSYQLEKDSQAG